MPRIETWICANKECGKQKGDSNHWWMAGEFGVFGADHDPKDTKVTATTFAIRVFDGKQHGSGEDAYCGDACVLKAASAYLSRRGEAAGARQ